MRCKMGRTIIIVNCHTIDSNCCFDVLGEPPHLLRRHSSQIHFDIERCKIRMPFRLFLALCAAGLLKCRHRDAFQARLTFRMRSTPPFISHRSHHGVRARTCCFTPILFVDGHRSVLCTVWSIKCSRLGYASQQYQFFFGLCSPIRLLSTGGRTSRACPESSKKPCSYSQESHLMVGQFTGWFSSHCIRRGRVQECPGWETRQIE